MSKVFLNYTVEIYNGRLRPWEKVLGDVLNYREDMTDMDDIIYRCDDDTIWESWGPRYTYKDERFPVWKLGELMISDKDLKSNYITVSKAQLFDTDDPDWTDKALEFCDEVYRKAQSIVEEKKKAGESKQKSEDKETED